MSTTTELGVDRKSTAQKWAAIARPGVCGHYFHEFDDVVRCQGMCSIHGKVCNVPASPDLATAGLPCQPFSSLRDHSKTDASEHDLFNVTFDMFFEYVRNVSPLGVLCEQVVGFKRTASDGTEETYMQKFCARLAEMGFSVRVVDLNTNLWSECDRRRCPVK